MPRHRRFEKKAQVTLSSTLRRIANASTNVDLDDLAVSGNQGENVQSLEAPEEEDIVRTEEPHHGMGHGKFSKRLHSLLSTSCSNKVESSLSKQEEAPNGHINFFIYTKRCCTAVCIDTRTSEQV